MTTRKHAIVSLSDAVCGDFAIEHWHSSLVDNVNLKDIDVIVLDYGLTPKQRKCLESKGVECRASEKNGWIGTMLWRDLAGLLKERDYDQVLTTDAGDIIFQADIRHLFEQDKDSYRAVCEDFDTCIHDVVMSRKDFDPEKWKEKYQQY